MSISFVVVYQVAVTTKSVTKFVSTEPLFLGAMQKLQASGHIFINWPKCNLVLCVCCLKTPYFTYIVDFTYIP